MAIATTVLDADGPTDKNWELRIAFAGKPVGEVQLGFDGWFSSNCDAWRNPPIIPPEAAFLALVPKAPLWRQSELAGQAHQLRSADDHTGPALTN